MAMKKLIITVRVNEYMDRSTNKHIPYTPDEIAQTAKECREAGASIIHFHARNSDGSPCYEPKVYAEIVEKIREKTDILVDSTLGVHTVKEDENRIIHIKLMSEKSNSRPDFAAVDTGSTNLDTYNPTTKSFNTLNKTYINSTETCLFLAKGMTNSGVKPHLSVWSIPFIRMTHALIDMGAIKEPAYMQCVLADDWHIGAHPGTNQGLQSMIDFIPNDKKIEWTVALKFGNLLKIAALSLENGGHLAPGLGDYAYPELSYPSNAELVYKFAELGRSLARPPASTNEARSMLGILQ
jgi:uncharacterized protein (DUF849 family)